METPKAKITDRNQVVLTGNKQKYPIKHTIDKILREELIIREELGGWKIPLAKNSKGNDKFKGFYYFNPEHLFERDSIFTPDSLRDKPINFLVTYDSEKQHPEEIAGVLKFGVYNCYGSLPNYWVINYVDVRIDKRNQGVCTSLFERLNEVLTPDDWLCGTPISEMGERFRLDKKLQQIITVCPYFDGSEDFYKYCIKNGLLSRKKEK